MPSASITEPLRVIYKQLFPLPQHVPSYLSCETQICVVNSHAQYKLAWPSTAPSFDQFFSIHRGRKLKLPGVLQPRWSPCSTLLKTSLCLSCLPDVISVSNGNHMLNANTTSSMSAPPGSCDAASPPLCIHTHTPPHHPQPLMSPLLFPTVSHLLHRALFCLTYTVSFCFPPFFVLAVVLSFKQTLSDLAGIPQPSCVHCTLFQSPTWRSLKWNWSGGSKNPLWWLYRFTSVANQLFYCNRGAALMRRGLFW